MAYAKPEPLTLRIPRVTAAQIAGAQMIAEQALHRAMYLVEGSPGSDREKIDRLPVLVVAWNRCTDAERAQFIAMLRQAEEDAAAERLAQARRNLRRSEHER